MTRLTNSAAGPPSLPRTSRRTLTDADLAGRARGLHGRAVGAVDRADPALLPDRAPHEAARGRGARSAGDHELAADQRVVAEVANVRAQRGRDRQHVAALEPIDLLREHDLAPRAQSQRATAQPLGDQPTSSLTGSQADRVEAALVLDDATVRLVGADDHPLVAAGQWARGADDDVRVAAVERAREVVADPVVRSSTTGQWCWRFGSRWRQREVRRAITRERAAGDLRAASSSETWTCGSKS